MFRKRKSERGGKPRRARTAFTYEQLVTIVDEMDLTGGSYDVICKGSHHLKKMWNFEKNFLKMVTPPPVLNLRNPYSDFFAHF